MDSVLNRAMVEMPWPKHGNQELGGMLLSCLDQTSLKFGSLLQRITDKRKRKNVEMKLKKSLEER
jgi:hypothetical protein